ncbi:MAG TPA: winged helix-turn-helix domain-containing protein [Solirubrobacteraceae bacterium]|jgi:DNA-binding response OmpR family regulator
MGSASRLERSSSPEATVGLIVVATSPGDVAALRAANPAAPIIALAADAATVIAALDGGADSVVSDAARTRELRARLDAVARRGNGALASISLGPLVIDPRARRATVDGVELRLAPRELTLLAELAATPGRLRTKAELLEICWGPNVPASRTLERHVIRLRARLGRRAAMLVTVWGAGYRLDEPT